MITGTSVKGSILPRGLSNQEAVHFGGMALKDTNALSTLKSSTVYQEVTLFKLTVVYGQSLSFPTPSPKLKSTFLYGLER